MLFLWNGRRLGNFLSAFSPFVLGLVFPVDTQSIILIFNECERWSCSNTSVSIMNDSVMEMDLVQTFSDLQMFPDMEKQICVASIVFDVNVFRV